MNYITICCQNLNNILFFLINQCKKKDEYTRISTNPNNNEDNNPAKILSSEEINEIIKSQKSYNEEQKNTNGYKIIKQKNIEDNSKAMHLEEIKNELNQIEFEEEEELKKIGKISNEINIESDNNTNTEEKIDDKNNGKQKEEESINIEQLKKDVMESGDD